jgi:Na+/phosphate symporter
MKTSTKIHQVSRRVDRLEKAIKEIIREIEDYDLKRLLKKVDAECLDVQHNLAIAQRLSEQLSHRGKKRKNTKRKASLK